MPRPITPATTLDNLKREAKRWLRELRAGDPDAHERLRRSLRAHPPEPTLRDVQHALAREHGVSGWAALKARLENAALRRYDAVAAALVAAYRTPDPAEMRMVWDYFGHMRAWDGLRRYVRLDLGGPEEPASPAEDFITLAQARYLVARAQGFESWEALAVFTASVPEGRPILPKQVGAHVAGSHEPLELPTTVLARSWDELLEAIEQRGLTGLHASGQMTDEVLARVARLDRIEELDLSGSRAISDAGLRHLAEMPRLRSLNLGGCPIGDPGLPALQRIASLERIVLAGTDVTDAGVARLASCRSIEVIDLSATGTGDGAIRALAGLPALRHFRSGDAVTDDGLALFREYPRFRRWAGDTASLHLFSFEDHPNLLKLRGRFTNAGLARLAACEGLYALNLDSSRLAVTGAGLAPLAALPHLTSLAFDAKDADMAHIAALPRLRHLVCQDTAAGDEGFVALSRSRSLEYLWGRRCHNLQRRGFEALAEIPSLRSLSVSCRNVDDAGLGALPRFPSLIELMPMDVPDEGYRHIAECVALESLVLMYCRETTDRSTELIAALPRLGKYFASYNRITDRTPEILSAMNTLEEVTFDSCSGVTDRGVASLARLPRLRRLRVAGMRGVTRSVVQGFRDDVSVRYAP